MGVAVGLGVDVGLGVGVAVGTAVGVAVGGGVGVAVGGGVGVAGGGGAGVAVGTAVGVEIGGTVGVAVGPSLLQAASKATRAPRSAAAVTSQRGETPSMTGLTSLSAAEGPTQHATARGSRRRGRGCGR